MTIYVEVLVGFRPIDWPNFGASRRLCGVWRSLPWPKSVLLLSHVLHASTVVLRDSDGGRVTLLVYSDTASVTGWWRSYSLVSRDARSWVGYACCLRDIGQLSRISADEAD